MSPHWIPRDQLEPEAVESFSVSGATTDSAIGSAAVQLSQAISLKRLADAAEEIAACVEPRDTNYPAGFRVRR